MLDGLESHFVPGHDPPQPEEHQEQYREAIRQQSAIGWRNFIKGRWSKEWRRLQAIYYDSQPEQIEGHNQTSWATSLIRKMWDQWYEMWESRNKDRHGGDAAASAEADRVQAIREIEMLYEDAELVAKQTGELDFFAAPIEDLLKKPTHVLLNWLSLWKELIQSAMDIPAA